MIEKQLINKHALPSNFHQQYITLLFKAENNLSELSSTQRKYAILLSMNISSKDIATIMNVNKTTVKQNAQRIRIKLGINRKKLNLRNYLTKRLN